VRCNSVDRVETSGCAACVAGSYGPNATAAACASCGPHALTLTDQRSGKAVGDAGATSSAQCFCRAGYYVRRSGAGIDCAECPAGARCAGHCWVAGVGCGGCEAASPCDAMPVPLKGYWASADAPHFVKKCEPAEVCEGGHYGNAASVSSCSTGYTGLAYSV
jgi:hypothetical protein